MGQVKVKPAAEVAEELKASTKRRLEQAVQRHLDDTAKERGYDGILSLCTYATSANSKFKAEGQAGVEWRDDVWDYCYGELDKVEAEEREIPSAEDLVAELPAFQWPE